MSCPSQKLAQSASSPRSTSWIEAVVEGEGGKLETFRDLDRRCRPEVILTTNPSSISVTKLAGATARPAQVMGMHFMNRAPVMKLVELVRGLQTDEATFATVRALAERLGKVPVEAADFPGFVVNRLLLPMHLRSPALRHSTCC